MAQSSGAPRGFDLQRRLKGGDGAREQVGPGLALGASGLVASAMPRLFWVMAQSCGASSRVRTSSAAS